MSEFYSRHSMQCIAASCRRWLSVAPEDKDTMKCPACGADLELVDLAKHMAALPVKQDTAEEIAIFESQKRKGG